MKKLLIILLIIITGVFIYFNLKGNKSSLKEEADRSKYKNTDSSRYIDSQETISPEIPEIYDLSKLIVDSKLKPVKLNLPDSIMVSNSEIRISAKVPSEIFLCDLFLFVNNKKKDMFYRIKGGTYEFKNVKLIQGKNRFEIFYRIAKKRSPSVSGIIVRK